MNRIIQVMQSIWILRKIGCITRLYHLRTKWDDKGIHCVDCTFFKSKGEHQADLHAGGGW